MVSLPVAYFSVKYRQVIGDYGPLNKALGSRCMVLLPPAQ